MMAGCGFAEAPGQEPDHVGKILELAAQAEPKDALPHLTRVVKILVSDKSLSQSERVDLTSRLARLLFEKARRPDDIQALVGHQTAKKVAREVFYGRYLEHWMFDPPLGLCVTLDCVKGLDPVVRGIRPWFADGS